MFTPSGICKEMVRTLIEGGGFGLTKDSLTSTCLEIACGEALFIASMYDMETGEPIAVRDRFGLLDKKLECASRARDGLIQGLALGALKSV